MLYAKVDGILYLIILTIKFREMTKTIKLRTSFMPIFTPFGVGY